MQALKDKLNLERYTKPTTKATSKRAHLLEQFLDKLNPSRMEAGFPELKPARIGMMLSHLSDDDIYFFFRNCEQYKGGFSKCFFGSLKKK